MYACTYETEGSFSRWCVLSMIRAALLLTHTPPCHARRRAEAAKSVASILG
jgi:hypothetical protein